MPQSSAAKTPTRTKASKPFNDTLGVGSEDTPKASLRSGAPPADNFVAAVQPRIRRTRKPEQPQQQAEDTSRRTIGVDVFGPEVAIPPNQTPSSRGQLNWLDFLATSKDTLVQLLRTQYPPIPVQLAATSTSRVSTNTRTLTEADLALLQEKQLSGVVPFPPLLDQLYERVFKLLADIDLSDPHFLCKINPDIIGSHLPRYIFTEHDTEDYLWALYVRPALALLHHFFSRNYRSTPFPNVSSVGGIAPVPDGGLFTKLNEIMAIVEVKNNGVLEHMQAHLEQLLRSWPQMPLGRAAKFNWPQTPHKLNKSTKIICQVWSQMVAKKVKYGVLSSYAQG
ncbi:hypothetical protein HGRIS_014695 [Hohenbuehelia grisea]|uniref:Uncharacterized protein n=1 Tax=Hohenbuehelia grisea TaxID=104357 RepID=A0ABR3JV63_9AGAR